MRQAREKLDLTLRAAAKAAGVNPQTWYNTECGCYALIPPAIDLFLERQGFSLHWLTTEYASYVAGCREEFGRAYLPDFARIFYSGDSHPFTQFRRFLGLSRQALAKELCVQPAVLYKFESGKTKAVPLQLRTALLEAGFPQVQFEELERKVKEWQLRQVRS